MNSRASVNAPVPVRDFDGTCRTTPATCGANDRDCMRAHDEIDSNLVYPLRQCWQTDLTDWEVGTVGLLPVALCAQKQKSSGLDMERR